MKLHEVKRGRKVRLIHLNEVITVGIPSTPGGMILCKNADGTESYYGRDTNVIPYRKRSSDA